VRCWRFKELALPGALQHGTAIPAVEMAAQR